MNQRGQNLIEVLIALGIFFIFISGVLVLNWRYLDTFARARDLQKVQNIADESFEALQSIAYDDWPAVVNGTYGLSSSSGKWQLQGQPDLIDNKYTRQVVISSVNRDENCDITPSASIDDPDSKLVTVTVSWQGQQQALSKTLNSHLMAWNNPTNCLEGETGEAANLIIDVSGAYIDTTKKSLFGVILKNRSGTAITLDKMTLAWTKLGSHITFIKIEGTNYWHYSNGIGLPQGAQLSGTELDLVDLVLAAYTDYDVDIFRFDDKVDGSTFTITATMLDGSHKTVVTTPPFIP
ncbi:MAG: hypothetical protein WC480_03695 [Patescibacteria group bacterium]